nr:MAG TPA: hypothetical protein [Caudoviricetes sp.]
MNQSYGRGFDPLQLHGQKHGGLIPPGKGINHS